MRACYTTPRRISAAPVGQAGGGKIFAVNRLVVRRVCSCVAVAATCCAATMLHAQEPTRFARLSAAVTPARVVDRGVLREQRVDLASAARLFEPDADRVIQLDLFPDLSVTAVRERVEISAAGRVWIGTTPDYDGGQVVISVSGDAVVANVWTFFGTYRIQRGLGGYVVQQIEAASTVDTNDAVVPPASGLGAGVVRKAPGSSRDDGSVIDVMVLYTPAVLAAWGSEAAANAAIATDVASVNTVFRNSHIPSTVRLVYSGVINYSESGSSATDLARLRTPNDGFMDSVQALRDQYAADLVSLIVTDVDACGRAYVRVPGEDSSFAYSVVGRGCVANARTSAHEWGHNLGLMHDWYVADASGYFADSHGYVSVLNGFYDVMAYPDLCAASRKSCQQLLQYASPDILFKSVPTGIRAGTDASCRAGDIAHTDCDADGVRTILTTLPQVAQYRDSSTNTAFFALVPAQSIVSANRQFSLTYQTDGNLVLMNTTTGVPTWWSNTTGSTPGVAILQTDGNLVIYNSGGGVLWNSGTSGNANARLVLQDDGNVVIYSSGGGPLWDAFSHPPGK